MGNTHTGTRRKVLKSLGGAGFFTGLASIPVAADETVEIVTGKSGETPVTINEVPEEWLNHLHHVRSLQDDLHNSHLTDDWVHSVGRQKADERINGLRKFRLVYKVTEPQLARSILPTEIEGIPISIQEKTPEEHIHLDDHDGSWCNTETVSCIKGGNLISTRYEDGGSTCTEQWGNLSITSTVKYGGKNHIMTSAHGFMQDINCADISGNPAYQGNFCRDNQESHKIGRVQSYNHSLDYALVDTDYMEVNSSSGVVGENQYIRSHVTKNGIDYMASADETAYNYGAKTCRSAGEVVGQDPQSNCNASHEWVQLTTNAAGGDSASPHYRYVSSGSQDYLELIGPHTYHETTWSRTCQCLVHQYSFAPAAHEIYNQDGVVFSEVKC